MNCRKHIVPLQSASPEVCATREAVSAMRISNSSGSFNAGTITHLWSGSLSLKSVEAVGFSCQITGGAVLEDDALPGSPLSASDFVLSNGGL